MFFRTPLHGPENAVRFKLQNGNNTYMVLGGTSAWPDDDNGHAENHDDFIVPSIPLGTVDVEEKFCAIKASVYWGIVDEDGTIEYRDADGVLTKLGTLNTAADVRTEKSGLVIVQAAGLGSQIIQSSFRKMGVYTGLVPTAGHENDSFLVAANVSSWGVLESLQWRKPQFVTNGSNMQYRVTDVLEFQ